ncbi:hypothetical protein [Pseudomonas sp. BIC9C]|uniref:hypothetical protein n=1 Tax=Pseudomonas sp. BIC9C TaxID=3078458 RepID=UPI002AD3BC20|nr:hypothetical protein [Pseudomonas sp. BIC9C]
MSISGIHKGDIEVADRLEVSGTVLGAVVVINGGILELGGTIKGKCVVEPCGEARIRGTVIGTLENYGGQVDVWGVVENLVDVGEGTRSIKHEHSIVKSYTRVN